MEKGIFAVLDTKSTIFSNPFVSINSAVAIRDFRGACNEPNSDINRNPADYALYRIGTYDDNLGAIKPITPENLGFATQFMAE